MRISDLAGDSAGSNGEPGDILRSRSAELPKRHDVRTRPQAIKIIGPSLHHLDAFRPVFGCVHISTPNIVRFLVCKLTLDGIGNTL